MHHVSCLTSPACWCQGSLAPTSAQVISAQPFNNTTPVATGSIAVNNTYTDYAGTVTGVSKTTSYNVWLVGEDNNTSPNIMPQVWSCRHVSGDDRHRQPMNAHLVWHLTDVMPWTASSSLAPALFSNIVLHGMQSRQPVGRWCAARLGDDSALLMCLAAAWAAMCSL